ncbi:hypothetical protein DFAR_3900014 [Desulfarculales bacterium]
MDGTPSTLALSALTLDHMKKVSAYMRDIIHVPYYEAENYVMLSSNTNIESLLDDPGPSAGSSTAPRWTSCTAVKCAWRTRSAPWRPTVRAPSPTPTATVPSWARACSSVTRLWPASKPWPRTCA